MVILGLVSCSIAQLFVVDNDSDCFYIPKTVLKSQNRVPALLYLHCQGAVKAHIDSIKFIADSVNWIIFSCHKSRNHRNLLENDQDIITCYKKALAKYPVDSNCVFIYGFSGQGVQALATLFLHPEFFRGVISECAHAQALVFADWPRLKNKLIYLSSRTNDWNLKYNYYMDSIFRIRKIKNTLVIRHGEHTPGSPCDIYGAIKWLIKNCR